MRKDHREIQELYQQEKVARLYEQTRFRSFIGKLGHELEITAINKALEAKKPSRLLEVATGTGRITRELKGFKSAIGIDSSPAMLTELKKKLNDRRWRFEQGDALKLRFATSSFDAVVTFRLLRHFIKNYRSQAYAEIRRVLKPGGILIFDACNQRRGFAGWLADAASSAMARIRGFRNAVHDVYYTKTKLIDELRHEGFEIISITPILCRYPRWSLMTFMEKFPHIGPKITKKYPLALALERTLMNTKAKHPQTWVIAVRKP